MPDRTKAARGEVFKVFYAAAIRSGWT